MTEQAAIEFKLEVSAEDATEDELDRMTRQLLSELRNMEVESAELAGGEAAPAGTKSVDPVTIGTLAITVLPTLLPKIVEFIQENGFLQNKSFFELFPMISEDTVLRELKDLIKKGIIKKEGTTKGVHYVLRTQG